MKLRFPYKPRPRQLETVRKIRDYIRKWHIVLQAPTGFGKTPVIIAALLPYIDKGYRVVWAVRTGSETDRPIEELRVFVKKMGIDIFGLSYRGKKDMCLLAKKFSEELDYTEVSYICSRERRKCPFYRSFKEFFDPTPFMERNAATYTEVFELAENMQICPYFVQRELLKYANIVSLSYNYVVNQYLEWSIRRYFPYSESILVVDEAHNLQSLNLESDAITEGTINRAIEEAATWGEKWIVESLKYIRDKIEEEFGHLREEEDREFNPSILLPDSPSRFLEEALKLGELVRRERMSTGQRPRSSLFHLASFFKRALELEGTRGIAFIAERVNNILRLNIWDMRSAEILSQRWRVFKRCIFSSGTLEPIEAFAETIGLTNYIPLRIPSPYDERNARVYLTEELTTRGEELSKEMARGYIHAIAGFLSRVKANTAIFTASYRIQSRLMEEGLGKVARELGFEILEERKAMSGIESRKILDEFKKLAREGRGLLVAPMGGRFAEGADFPGEELKAVFLVGIPFEKPTVKTRLYVEYYRALYGEEKGRFYAYIYPALRRAAQALGRALRSPEDQAVIVLGDKRYRSYLSLLPDYVSELVKSIKIEEFSSIEVPWEN